MGVGAGNVGALATLASSAPTVGRKKETAMRRTARLTADVESTAEKRNDGTPMGYLGRTALRREQCSGI
jgi:hypothetical protein